MQDIKHLVFEACAAYIEARIQNATIALKQAQDASNDDTKSSAGDKYETTREMMQQDIARNKTLLVDAEQQRILLSGLQQVSASDVVKNGNLIVTNQGVFYLSISAGQLKLDDRQIYAVSAVSPIGKLLLGKKVGDAFEFNRRRYLIEEIA